MRGAGRGILLTGIQRIPSGLDWAAVLYAGNAAARVAALRASGVTTIYVWDHPSRFHRDGWESGLATLANFARQQRLTGVIIDAENTWTTADRPEARRMGAAAEILSREMEVGFTSFPGWPCLAAFAETCGRLVWGLVQIYNRGSNEARVFAAWLAQFRRAIPSTIVIAATFIPEHGHGRELATRSGFEAYLAKLPTSYGFATYGSGPGYMMDAIDSYRPITAAPIVASMLGFLAGLPGAGLVPLPVLVTVLALVCALVFGVVGWYLWKEV